MSVCGAKEDLFPGYALEKVREKQIPDLTFVPHFFYDLFFCSVDGYDIVQVRDDH